MKQSKVRRNLAPVVKDVGNSLETTGSHSSRAGVTSINGPKHEVALVWIQLQQQHHGLTTELMNLKDAVMDPVKLRFDYFNQSEPMPHIVVVTGKR